MRSVSDVALGTAPEISQNKCPNNREVSGGFPGLISFSIRSVARPVNGAGLLGHSGMPDGCGPAVGMPAVTNVEFAAWKISTRDNDGFVRYSSRWLAE